jgi:hypothetical protein
MLRSYAELTAYRIGATDGAIGHVRDCYFDDVAWVVRYLVVDTAHWLSGRRVLISPMSVGAPDAALHEFPVSMTRAQVEGSPDIDTARPVSRQHEMRYLDYYSYPYYWGGLGFWGGGYYPSDLVAANRIDIRPADREALNADPHLRSCDAVLRYRVSASDGEVGHVSGYLVDTETWAIRYLVVETSHWLLGHSVLVSPLWIERISWGDTSVVIDLTRQAIQGAPRYEARLPLQRDEEIAIYRHYARAGYWTTEPLRQAA